MSKCSMNHSLEDVGKKLEEQQRFLPQELHIKCQQFVNKQPNQMTLNEIFHLLKKYDLASEEVRRERDIGLEQLL